jgi:o-succinylbenzoate synthase
MTIRISKKNLIFRFAARTSRNTMLERPIWIVELEEKGVVGIGECAPIFGLSLETEENLLKAFQSLINNPIDWKNDLDFCRSHSALSMALETALADLNSGGLGHPFFNAVEHSAIPINGLVWMDEIDAMYNQAKEKIASGFSTIKLKVGAHSFSEERELIESLRREFPPDKITIRLDANGAWSASQAISNLRELQPLHIHSIEQPLNAAELETLRDLCAMNLIPVALDESLIGNFSMGQKAELLQFVQPQYIILKPSLHGGFSGCNEWIDIAEPLGIQWWATSALESSIGLNAIARWVLSKKISVPQGLGTGSLFTNNFKSPWSVENGQLIYGQSADMPIIWEE